MVNFFEHILNLASDLRPWLVIGKGPTFGSVSTLNLSEFKTVALNHVIKEISVDYAHAIDLDVVKDCAREICANSRFLIMPLYPHVENKPSGRPVHTYFEECPELAELDKCGRLIIYNSSTGACFDTDYPIIPVRFFSADAVVALLAYSGFSVIRTLGVDGGRSYSGRFSDLNHKTLLSNGQPNFNVQFRAMAKTMLETGVNVIPMDINSPIRVFVGTQDEQMIAVKVLHYSIQKNTGSTVELFPLNKSDIRIPTPKDKANQPRTPFSFQRFLIPQLCGYEGRAIYVDSGMQVFFDIRDLWDREFGDSNVLSAWADEGGARIPQYSVMLLNCSSLNWKISDLVESLDRGEYGYEDLMYRMVVANVSAAIEPEWNSLESYEDGKTKLLHYTDMNEQPWLSTLNPLSELWVCELKEAIGEGYVSMLEVLDSVLAGEMRPSLVVDLRKDRYDEKEYIKIRKRVDKGFIPPHKRLFGLEKDSFKKRAARKVVRLWLISLRRKYEK